MCEGDGGGGGLSAGLTLWVPGFEFRPVRVGFLVEKAAMGRVLLLVIRFSRVTIVPAMFHIRSSLRHVV